MFRSNWHTNDKHKSCNWHACWIKRDPWTDRERETKGRWEEGERDDDDEDDDDEEEDDEAGGGKENSAPEPWYSLQFDTSKSMSCRKDFNVIYPESFNLSIISYKQIGNWIIRKYSGSASLYTEKKHKGIKEGETRKFSKIMQRLTDLLVPQKVETDE